jgi:hypothetical protein
MLVISSRVYFCLQLFFFLTRSSARCALATHTYTRSDTPDRFRALAAASFYVPEGNGFAMARWGAALVLAWSDGLRTRAVAPAGGGTVPVVVVPGGTEDESHLLGAQFQASADSLGTCAM